MQILNFMEHAGEYATGYPRHVLGACTVDTRARVEGGRGPFFLIMFFYHR